MESKERIFPKLYCQRKAEERKKETRTAFEGLNLKEAGGESYSSMSLEQYPCLTPEKKLVPLFQTQNTGLSDIRRIGVYHDNLFILNMEDGHFGFYRYHQSDLKKTYTTVETYHYADDGRSIFKNLIYTKDQGEKMEKGEKLLLFPMNKYLSLKEGTLNELPLIVPDLDFATVMGGRLFGIFENSLWISGSGGCFDWTYNSKEDKDETHAFMMRFGTSAEREQPVTAFCSYKGNILIFRKNCIQRIEGEGTPFRVKDLFKIGAEKGESVQEAGGNLYFISENRGYELHESVLNPLPLLPQDVKLTGVGGVYRGRYLMAAEQNGEDLLLSYDRERNSYGVMKTDGKIEQMLCKQDNCYLLINKNGKKEIDVFANRSTEDIFKWNFPLMKKAMGKAALLSLKMRGEVRAHSYLSASVKVTFENGTFKSYHLASFYSGAFYFEKKEQFPIGIRTELEITGGGDVILEGYEAEYREIR